MDKQEEIAELNRLRLDVHAQANAISAEADAIGRTWNHLEGHRNLAIALLADCLKAEEDALYEKWLPLRHELERIWRALKDLGHPGY